MLCRGLDKSAGEEQNIVKNGQYFPRLAALFMSIIAEQPSKVQCEYGKLLQRNRIVDAGGAYCD